MFQKIITSFILLTLVACTSAKQHPLYTPSNIETIDDYDTFEQYVALTKQQLMDNRYFLTQDIAAELSANMPAEFKPAGVSSPSKGVLLIHGLGDSPYSFVNISKSLQEKGMLVRTILLNGHGTRPADMLAVDYQQWNNLVKKQVALLKQEVDEVYIGGFSTGGNLAYSYAVEDESIKGLMLFSPGLISNEPLDFFTPWISWIKPWLLDVEPKNITNYTRYFMVPTNGFAQYYKTSKQATDKLNKRTFDRPVFMVLTEHDSVLDTPAIKALFDKQFTHKDNKLIWFGSEPSSVIGKHRYINSYQPELRISNMSHMGILFSPDNPYYGINGSEKMCRNGSDMTDEDIKACNEGAEVWYSAWDGKANENIHARLTFNPWYDIMVSDLDATFSLDNTAQ